MSPRNWNGDEVQLYWLKQTLISQMTCRCTRKVSISITNTEQSFDSQLPVHHKADSRKSAQWHQHLKNQRSIPATPWLCSVQKWIGVKRHDITCITKSFKLEQQKQVSFVVKDSTPWALQLAWSDVSCQLSSPAPMLSSSCSIFFAPIITELTVSWCSSHFRATCGMLLSIDIAKYSCYRYRVCCISSRSYWLAQHHVQQLRQSIGPFISHVLSD